MAFACTDGEVQTLQHSSITEYENTDLRSLVAHRHFIQVNDKISRVYDVFERCQVEHLAVLDGDQVVGMCTREKLGLLLSHQFGRSLFLKQHVGNRLLEEETRVTITEPISQVLEKAFYRPEDSFFKDVLLVDEDDRYIGMIPMQALVRLQNKYLVNHIDLLKAQQKELNEKNRQMEQELAMAQDIQRAFLPIEPKTNGHHPRLTYYYRYAPAATLSGDFIQVLHCSEQSLGILICDVMGHGVRSALITAMIRALVDRLTAYHSKPGELLEQMNRGLMGMLQQYSEIIFVTACCMVIDKEERRVQLARAGHHFPLLVRSRNSVEEIGRDLDRFEPAIGLYPDSTYHTEVSPLEEGDLFLMYTDGLFEVTDSKGREFGHERLLDVITQHRNKPSQDLLDRVIEEVRDFSASQVFEDDVCLVGLEYR